MVEMWTFKGYVDDTDTNVFDAWYEDLPTKAQAKLDWILKLFEPRPNNEWISKYFKKLKGYENLYEVRFEIQGIVYRPLGSFAPFRKDFTFTIGTTKKRKDVLIPIDAENIALRRLDLILQNPNERARECEFETEKAEISKETH
jgi:hypothetical protein